MEPRYDGNKTVMQQGANSAAIPATNAVTRDAMISVSMLVIIYPVRSPICPKSMVGIRLRRITSNGI